MGDVIAFNVPLDAQQRLKLPPTAVHRVIGIEGDQGQLVFVTKGDNSGTDPFKVPPSAVRRVVVKNLGPWGRPLLFLTNRAALLYLGLPIFTFVLIALATLWLAPSEKREVPAAAPMAKPRPERRKRVSPATTVAGRPGDFERALGGLTSAMAEYGVHLQSHTAVVKNLGETSQAVRRAERQQSHNSLQLSVAVQRQNEVLADLEEVVREMRGEMKQNGKHQEPQASGNGEERSSDAYLAAMVQELKEQRRQNGKRQQAQASGNGEKTSSNRATKTVSRK